MNKHRSMTALNAIIMVLIMVTASAAGVDITDTRGRQVHFETVPVRAVSIVPSITEIICNLGAAEFLAGVTYHSSLPCQKNHKPIVGGFSSPSVETIKALNPDVVFVSGFQEKNRGAAGQSEHQNLCLDITSYDQGIQNIETLARIFNREKKGRALLAAMEADMAVIAEKLAKLDGIERKRVFRLMGRDRVMTPTANAFLNQLVIRAGGIPMAPEGDGMVAEVSLEQWQKFNPQVIFGCGEDRRAAEKYFNLPGWRDVDAVRHNRILYFPCEMTCRVSTDTGYFVQWLAASIYSEAFFTPGNQVHPDELLTSEPIPIHQNLVKESRRVTSRIADFKHKTLVIDFTTPPGGDLHPGRV